MIEIVQFFDTRLRTQPDRGEAGVECRKISEVLKACVEMKIPATGTSLPADRRSIQIRKFEDQVLARPLTPPCNEKLAGLRVEGEF